MHNREGTLNIRGIHYATGEVIEVGVDNGIITDIVRCDSEGRRGEKEGLNSLPYIGPGLVDLQINGYAGHDFNTLPLSPSSVAEVIRKLWAEGVTSCCPTIITNGDREIEAAVQAVAQACEEDPSAGAGIAGIHLEGPFITPEDGPRGAHAKKYVRAPDWESFERWQEAAGGRIRIVTLSPEWEEAPAFIERCAASGVIVSIGHTSASPEQIREAVRAGAVMSTHLGNGAHLKLPRHPNYLWEQLADDSLHACLIADGFHLPDSFLKVALRAKGERVMLVSDAVSLSGMAPGVYDMHIGGRVRLTEEGRLCMADQPELLAGSAQMLPWGISKLAGSGLADLPTAWEMASLRPARLLGAPVESGLSAGAPADLVLFDYHGGRVTIRQTIKQGTIVYRG